MKKTVCGNAVQCLISKFDWYFTENENFVGYSFGDMLDYFEILSWYRILLDEIGYDLTSEDMCLVKSKFYSKLHTRIVLGR